MTTVVVSCCKMAKQSNDEKQRNVEGVSFELKCSFKANGEIPTHKYVSRKTGITLVLAEVDGPVVGGYFGFATEALDDDGLPHTLEHLVFLGSEDYPYKGILDLWANRCLASGTNAHTDRDHTIYTMSTAGCEGFLSLMPVYLEHILYPTLKESAFLTEVHHITADGEDAGVVYCEMQGQENVGECLVYNELCRAAYPGRCGYKSVTGGALRNLRESTDNRKVREYHKEFYRAENLTVVVTGRVKPADLFEALCPLEEKIVSRRNETSFQRPWQNPAPSLESSIDLDVFYPCDQEDNGLVSVGWRGPSVVEEFYDLFGCSLLLKYLTDTSVSPLQREFVEVDDPSASNVAYSLAEYTSSLLHLSFEGVPKQKISLVSDRLMNVLREVYEKGVDMKRMKTVIHKYILEMTSAFENNPQDTVAEIVFVHALYDDTEVQLDRKLNQIRELKQLADEPDSYWKNLLERWLINAPVVVIRGIPSLEKQRELAEKEEQRIAKQIESLGEEGLRRKAEELEKAIAENERPVPNDLLSAVSIPSTDSINFHHVTSFSTESSVQHAKLDLTRLPVFSYLDDVRTNFVYMFVIMDTSSLPTALRSYIPILLEVIRESPIRRNGITIPYEQVVTELEADTVAICAETGLEKHSTGRFSCGSFSHCVNLTLQLEPRKYVKGISWIREILYETQFVPERLRVIATKMLNDVPQLKRKGSRVTGDLIKGLTYNRDSNHFASSILRQQKFLNDLVERLTSGEASQENVLKEIEIVRNILTNPSNINLYMAMNVEKLSEQFPDIRTPWEDELGSTKWAQHGSLVRTRLKIPADWTLISTESEEIPLKGCVTGLGCIESSFMCQCCKSICDYNSPDLPPLIVCLQYLTQLEGPMWRLIRGQGLSYGYNVFPKPSEGLLYLTFYRATNAVAAYKEAKDIVETHLSGANRWKKLLYESAKSSLIFEIIEKEKSIGDTVIESLLFHFKNMPHDYNRRLVKRISDVTIEDMHRVALEYVKPLFDPEKCKTAVVCHPSKTQEIAEAFGTLGHILKVYDSLEETYLNYW